MLALRITGSELNNFVRVCFILMLISLSAAAQQGKMTTVVRADRKSGRLIRGVLMEPKAAVVKTDMKAMIDRIADEQGVESQLVHSVIRVESNYNAGAVSPKGAQGIMQLIPSTARRFGVANVFDPRENIEGGVKYLRFLLDYFKGDYAKAIAAYNAGENAVEKYKGVPPFAETQNYVSQVARNLEAARKAGPNAGTPLAEGLVAQAAAKPDSGNNRETVQRIQTSTGSDGLIYYRTP